jgi:hypothetical protein
VRGGYRAGDVDEERGCFEEGDDEERVVIWVEFGGVDGCLEFGGADSGLCGEIPETSATVLGGCQEVSATARPTNVEVSGKGPFRMVT